MKILFAFLLIVIPILWDLFVGRVFWKHKTTVHHMVTASGRGIIMIVLSILNHSVEFWQSALLTVSFHTIVFPILYNRLIMHERFDFLGTSALFDRVEQKVRNVISTPGVFLLKIIFLMAGISYYVSSTLY